MKNINKMESKNYSTFIIVNQPPHVVFNCIKEVTKWWSKDFEGNSSQLNDEFIIHHPDQHYSKQKLVEVFTGKKIVWLVTNSKLYWLQNDKDEWTNSKMVFELRPEGDKTMLHFTHEGLLPGMKCYSMCEKGWTMIINSWLLHFITHGTESPEMTKAVEIRNKIFNDRSKQL